MMGVLRGLPLARIPQAAAAAQGMNPALLAAAGLGAGAVGLGANALLNGGNDYGDITDPAQQMYQRQLQDSISTGERAGNFKRDLEREAMQQAYGNQRGLADQANDAEMNQLQANLKAKQATDLLNGYLSAMGTASGGAANAASTRYY